MVKKFFWPIRKKNLSFISRIKKILKFDIQASLNYKDFMRWCSIRPVFFLLQKSIGVLAASCSVLSSHNTKFVLLAVARTFLLIVQTIHATKGQLISKTIFLVLIWTKNQMKLFFDYCPKGLKWVKSKKWRHFIVSIRGI